MKKKPGKSPPARSKKTERAAAPGKAANEKATAKPVRRAAEGPDNLRQRAEWFRSRAGNAR
jgi:hypothetical protein